MNLDRLSNRGLYIMMGIGGGILLFGFIILTFLRSYVFDGSKYDLFMIFGVCICVIGALIGIGAFVMQIKVYLSANANKSNHRQPMYMPPSHMMPADPAYRGYSQPGPISTLQPPVYTDNKQYNFSSASLMVRPYSANPQLPPRTPYYPGAEKQQLSTIERGNQNEIFTPKSSSQSDI